MPPTLSGTILGLIQSGLDLTPLNVGPRTLLTTFVGDWSVASQGSPAGRDITGRILLDKVGTYRDFRARGGANVSANGVVIEYFELGPDTGNATNNGLGAGIGYGGYTARYGKIHNFSDGAKLEGGTLEFCWIYNLTQESASDHNDGIQASSGSNITIRGCRISRTEGQIQTSCVIIGADLGNISNVLIEDCLFESLPGFQVALYWGHGGSWSASGCTIRNNFFTPTFSTLLSNNDTYVASGNRFVTGSVGAWVVGALTTALNNS